MKVLTEIRNIDGQFFGIISFHKNIQEEVIDILDTKYESLNIKLYKSAHNNNYIDIATGFHEVDDAVKWIDSTSELICNVKT